MLAEFYLVIIIVFVTLLLNFASRWMQKDRTDAMAAKHPQA